MFIVYFGFCCQFWIYRNNNIKKTYKKYIKIICLTVLDIKTHILIVVVTLLLDSLLCLRASFLALRGANTLTFDSPWLFLDPVAFILHPFW